MPTMTTVYVIMGVLTSVVVFLYVTPVIRKINEKKTGPKAPSEHFYHHKPSAEELVKCPKCGALLSCNDKIYTKTYQAEPRNKVFIRGCSHCVDPRTGKRIKKNK